MLFHKAFSSFLFRFFLQFRFTHSLLLRPDLTICIHFHHPSSFGFICFFFIYFFFEFWFHVSAHVVRLVRSSNHGQAENSRVSEVGALFCFARFVAECSASLLLLPRNTPTHTHTFKSLESSSKSVWIDRFSHLPQSFSRNITQFQYVDKLGRHSGRIWINSNRDLIKFNHLLPTCIEFNFMFSFSMYTIVFCRHWFD